MNMNRRDFVGFAALAAGGCCLPDCGGRRMKLGCQLWSVKDIWQRNGDVTSVFPRLAEMGYEGVQSMAFWDCDPDKLESALKANGLEIVDMPVSFERVDTDAALAKTVAFCRRFNVDFLYIPWFGGKKVADWRGFCDHLADVGERLKPHGIRIGYHHHIQEFGRPMEGGVLAWDVLTKDPRVNFEPDVGPMTESGGDAVSILRSIGGRIPCGFHMKPFPGSAAGAADDRQDWPAIVAAARAAGAKWAVVECEKRKDTFEDVAASARFLRPLLDCGLAASPVGWEDVFAKDLSNAEENGKGWKWDENGFLTPVTEDTIFSRKDYKNFVLNVAYVMDPTANGGLFLYDTKHPTHKFEVQILDDHHPMYEKEVPYQNTGSIYGRLAPAKVNSYPAGEINVMSCWCMGSRIRITLNYETVVDTDLSAWKDPLVNPDGTRVPKWHEGFPALATIPMHGRIALQGIHGGKAVRYKYLKVKEL